MKNILSTIIMGAALTLGMTGCMDDFDAPNVSDYSIFSQKSVGEVNSTIADVKAKYCESSAGATYSRTSSNWEFKIDEDVIIEGVVVSNDGQYGALYQQVILRSFEGADNLVNGSNVGHCIQLGVKNTCLYPYFAIGQKLRINLKGLYVGVYSKTPKIGYPYFTSMGNHNLGPMPFEMCATNIEKVGEPNPDCPECVPVDLTGNKWPTMKPQFSPMYATIRGSFPDADGKAILAPDELEDAGYAVDREFKMTSSTLKMTVRTSTGNELSQIVMPSEEVTITGILSYYSNWQFQFREPGDMKE